MWTSTDTRHLVNVPGKEVLDCLACDCCDESDPAFAISSTGIDPDLIDPHADYSVTETDYGFSWRLPLEDPQIPHPVEDLVFSNPAFSGPVPHFLGKPIHAGVFRKETLRWLKALRSAYNTQYNRQLRAVYKALEQFALEYGIQEIASGQRVSTLVDPDRARRLKKRLRQILEPASELVMEKAIRKGDSLGVWAAGSAHIELKSNVSTFAGQVIRTKEDGKLASLASLRPMDAPAYLSLRDIGALYDLALRSDGTPWREDGTKIVMPKAYGKHQFRLSQPFPPGIVNAKMEIPADPTQHHAVTFHFWRSVETEPAQKIFAADGIDPGHREAIHSYHFGGFPTTDCAEEAAFFADTAPSPAIADQFLGFVPNCVKINYREYGHQLTASRVVTIENRAPEQGDWFRMAHDVITPMLVQSGSVVVWPVRGFCSTQICPVCGRRGAIETKSKDGVLYKVLYCDPSKNTLANRTDREFHAIPGCGAVVPRDASAAYNFAEEGINVLDALCQGKAKWRYVTGDGDYYERMMYRRLKAVGVTCLVVKRGGLKSNSQRYQTHGNWMKGERREDWENDYVFLPVGFDTQFPGSQIDGKPFGYRLPRITTLGGFDYKPTGRS